MKEIFTDGIADIILSRGLVSIDFYHLLPKGDKGPHQSVPFLRLTIPVNGLFGLYDTSKTVLNHLIDTGVFTAKPVSKKDVAPAVEKKAGKKPAPAKKAEAKSAAKPAPAPAKKAETKPVAKPAPAPAKKAEAKPVAKPAPAPAKKAEAKPVAKPAPAPAKKAEAKPAAKLAPAPAKKAVPVPAKKPAAKGKKK